MAALARGDLKIRSMPGGIDTFSGLSDALRGALLLTLRRACATGACAVTVAVAASVWRAHLAPRLRNAASPAEQGLMATRDDMARGRPGALARARPPARDNWNVTLMLEIGMWARAE